MSSDGTEEKTQERFHHLLSVISSERFLKKQGLGNEVPFFICSFEPKETIPMERLQQQLKNKLSQKGIRILDINIYNMVIDILKESEDWEWYIAEESSMTKDELKDELQSILDVETVLTPAMAAKIKTAEFDVMFLTGIGEVFPYIRSHNILNNLQSTAKEKPTIMFFPGKYTHSLESGASLDLFGRLHDDKYYRAFDIDHYEV
jgi:hypothetical protein